MPIPSVSRYELHHVEAGWDFWLLLIDGLACDHSARTVQTESWAENHRVVAFENRGAGRSTQVDEPISTQDMARDALRSVRKTCALTTCSRSLPAAPSDCPCRGTSKPLTSSSSPARSPAIHAARHRADRRSLAMDCTLAGPGPVCRAHGLGVQTIATGE